MWLQAVTSSGFPYSSLCACWLFHPAREGGKLYTWHLHLKKGVLSLDDWVQNHPKTEPNHISMVRVPKHICDLLGHSFHGHPLPPTPADTLGELGSLLNLSPPCHSRRANSAFQPFDQHPSSPSSDSLHKCSANLLLPTAGSLSGVIKNRSCCSSQHAGLSLAPDQLSMNP